MEILVKFVQQNWFFLVIIAGLLYALWLQRRRVTSFVSSQEFEALVNAGFPVIAEFFDET